MFIRPSDEELAGFKPDFIVMNGAKCTNPQWKEQGLNSENFVAFNLTERMQLIGGTVRRRNEERDVLNDELPAAAEGIASMHCSANVGEKGDVAVFFGLSGTGKTTLSTDPKRRLIGDDEHGWDDDGVFNFEGGCYAKLSSCRKKRNLKSTTLSVVMRCWKTSPCVKMALSTLMMVQNREHPRFLSDLSHRKHR